MEHVNKTMKTKKRVKSREAINNRDGSRQKDSKIFPQKQELTEPVIDDSNDRAEVKKHTIMIVDDDRDSVNELMFLLSNEGYNIIPAYNGNEAYQMVLRMKNPEDISIIVSDQRMHGMTGVELFLKIKDIIPNTIRILLTALSDENVLISAINKAHIHQYIMKPLIKIDEFIFTIKRAIEAFEYSKRGRKQLLVNIEIDCLHPDAQNPRFPKKLRDKSEIETIAILKQYFDLEELAYSMAANGYFDEEPVVAVPNNLPAQFTGKTAGELSNDLDFLKYIRDNSTHFTVVEGNRRLASAKILLSEQLRSELKIKTWPDITGEVNNDLSILPVIVYRSRQEVLPYMGVRHISGIKKWDSYSRALYIAYLIEQNMTVDEIRGLVGDRSDSVRKIYLCYKLFETAEKEFEWDIGKAANYFSYLLLAVGQGQVKDFLGIPKVLVDVDFDNPVPNDKLENLKHLFSWLFGRGVEELAVIKEPGDITNYLVPVLKNEEAVEHLRLTRDLTDSYERCDGENVLLKRNLRKANKWIESSIGIVSRHKKDEDMLKEIERYEGNLDTIKKILEG
jgi:CheY-like chemotaxis protein